MPVISDEPKIPGYFVFASSNCKYDSFESFGQGIHGQEIIARIKAQGEFHERLCSYNVANDLLSLRYDSDSSSLVDPVVFMNVHSPDARAVDLLRQERMSWIKAEELASGRSLLIPAQLAYLCTFPKDPLIRLEQISTGTALGTAGSDDALISGILECVERDACMYHYYNNSELCRIINLPENIDFLVGYLKRYLLDVVLLDATSILKIPTVIAISRDLTGIGHAVGVGSASRLSYATACEHAILESIQCRRFYRISIPEDYTKGIDSLNARFAYWGSIERIDALSIWVESSNTVDFDSLEAAREPLEGHSLISQCRDFGCDLFVVDITLPEVADCGFEVKKVIIPQLQPLFLSEKAAVTWSKLHGSLQYHTRLNPHPFC